MYQHSLYLRVMGQHSLMYLCFCKNTQLSRIDHLHVLNGFFKKQFQVGFGDNTVFDKMKSNDQKFYTIKSRSSRFTFFVDQ